MRNFLIVSSLIILATLLACSTPSPELAAPTLQATTEEPISEPTEQPTMAPTATVAVATLTLGSSTQEPAFAPTAQPTMAPTATVAVASPTLGAPTGEPTEQPTIAPTATVAPTPTEPMAQASPTWRGVAVAAEHRCSPYDSDDYPYPSSVEPKIVAAQGGIYGPYTGTWFDQHQADGHRAYRRPIRGP